MVLGKHAACDECFECCNGDMTHKNSDIQYMQSYKIPTLRVLSCFWFDSADYAGIDKRELLFQFQPYGIIVRNSPRLR